MTAPAKTATVDQMRALNSIFDELIRRLHAHHTRPDEHTAANAQQTRTAYQQELRNVFG